MSVTVYHVPSTLHYAVYDEHPTSLGNSYSVTINITQALSMASYTSEYRLYSLGIALAADGGQTLPGFNASSLL